MTEEQPRSPTTPAPRSRAPSHVVIWVPTASRSPYPRRPRPTPSRRVRRRRRADESDLTEPGRAAGQGDADRQHDPPAARGGEGGPARRGQPPAAEGDPPAVDQGARVRPGARAGRRAGAADPAVHRATSTPTDAELRIAQAQLVGWLEGLFHGIQTAIYAQQMAARAQFEQMRRALPPGVQIAGQPGGPDGQPGQGEPRPAGLRADVPLGQPSRERPSAPKTIRPSRPTTSAAPGAAIRVSDAGSAPSTVLNFASAGVGGTGVVPWPSRATSFWVRALVAGPVPPQLLASRLAPVGAHEEEVAVVGRHAGQAARLLGGVGLHVTVGEVMSPL